MECFRRCSRNRVNMFGRQRAFSLKVGELRLPLRGTFQRTPRKFGTEIGLILKCRLRCDDSESTSRAIQRKWSTGFSWREIAGPVPEIPIEYDQILKGGRFWDDVYGGYLVLAARREEIDCVHYEGVYETVPMQECRDAGLKPLDLIWVDTDKSVDPTCKKIRSRLCAREYKTKKQAKIQRALPASQLFSAMPLLWRWRCLSQSLCLWVCRTKGNHWNWDEQPRDSLKFDYPQRIVRSVAKTMLVDLIKSMYETQDASHIGQLDYVNPIRGELGGFQRSKHNALFHNPIQDVRTAVHGDDCVFVRRWWFKHIDSPPKSIYTAKDMGTLGFNDSDVKSLQLINRVFRVGVDQTGQYLDNEPDLRLAPLIISESGCNSNTRAVSTPRERNHKTNWC